MFHLYFPKEFNLRHQGEWKQLSNPLLHHFDLNMVYNDNQMLDEAKIHPGQEFSLSESNLRNRVCLVLSDQYASLEVVYYGRYEFFGENMSPISGDIEFRFENSTSIIKVI